MNLRNFLRPAAIVLLAPAMLALPALAQPAAPSGSIHGHVQNAAGIAPGTGEVKLTQDPGIDDKTRKYLYSFPVNATGDYKGTGIKPGTYVLFYVAKGASVDYIRDVVIKTDVDLTQNDDMSREEFLKNMSAEDKKALDDFKKANAVAVAANKTIGNLNTLLSSAREAQKASKYDDAIAIMTQATTQKPDEAILWLELGNSQLGGKKYDDAVTSFTKATELNAASKKPSPALAGSAYNNLGQSYAKLNKPKDASAAYEKAAAAEPEKAANYYFNESAQLYNANARTEAVAAADKAIAADPTKADAYYIKGQSLVADSKADPKTQKLLPPPGCLEAYEKYLQIAPTGVHADEVKAIISAFDEKIVSGFKNTPAPKKK